MTETAEKGGRESLSEGETKERGGWQIGFRHSRSPAGALGAQTPDGSQNLLTMLHWPIRLMKMGCSIWQCHELLCYFQWQLSCYKVREKMSTLSWVIQKLYYNPNLCWVPTALTYLSCSLTPSVAIWSHWSLTDEIKDNSGWLLVFSEDQITSPRGNVHVQNSSVKSFWLICKTGIFLIVISPASRMALTMAASISTFQTIGLPINLALISVVPGGVEANDFSDYLAFQHHHQVKISHIYLSACLNCWGQLRISNLNLRV